MTAQTARVTTSRTGKAEPLASTERSPVDSAPVGTVDDLAQALAGVGDGVEVAVVRGVEDLTVAVTLAAPAPAND